MTFSLDSRQLGEDQTLAECGIVDSSKLCADRAGREATRRRYGNGFNDDPATELLRRLEKAQKREKRKREREERACEEVGEAYDMKPIEIYADPTTEDVIEDQSREEGVVNVGREVEEGRERQAREEESPMEESRLAGTFGIAAERPDRVLLDIGTIESGWEEDEDKENWDPQILRVGRAVDPMERRRRRALHAVAEV